MTERRLIESALGLAGRLSYTPCGTDKAGDHGWRSSRKFTRNSPVLSLLGPCKTWIPAEPAHVADSPSPSGTLWEQSRRQKKWLVKNYPEASLGNYVLDDHFAEESRALSPQRDSCEHTCVFALGELTNTSLQKNTGVPLLVTVSGSANNILRLARLDQERWTWSREPNVAVRLSEVATEKPALWIDEDLSPIRRVKCIVDQKKYNPTRWLAVQRDSGTTIFQPEYRKAPEDGSPEGNDSRIAANPLFHLSREETGGNIHSDISFNTGGRSNQPQLAVIDERGFWSIWDVRYTRNKSSGKSAPSLKACGHIDHGVLQQLPYRDRSTTRWHKILWVGRSEDNLDLLGKLDLDADNDESSSQSAFPSLQRSSSVIVCNLQQVRLFDLNAGVYLPDMEFLRHDSVDCILDIHITHDPQYFYVLTTSKLFVVRAYSRPGVQWDQPEKVWSIVFSTPHFRSPFDRSLRLALAPGVTSDQATSLVFIYSSTNPWIDLFCLEFSPTHPNGVRCRANVPGLSSLQNTMFNNATRTLCINPIPIIVKAPNLLKKMGHDLAEQRLKLYQIAALRSDMSIVSALCVYSLSSSIKISVPNVRVGRRSKGGPRKALRSSYDYVVDDDSETSEEGALSVDSRYIKAFYEHLISASVSLNKGYSAQPARNANNPFDGARRSIEGALNNELMPTHTLFQIMSDFKQMSGRPFFDVDWEIEIGRLNNIHPDVVVYTSDMLHSCLGFSTSAPLQEAKSKFLEMAHNSMQTRDSGDVHERRVEAISEQVISDLYLSLHSVGYRHTSSDPSQAAAEGNTPLASQPESLPSSPPRFESPASTPWSQRSNSEAVEGEDPSMTLFRTYTGSGKFVPEKKFELLDKWQLGAAVSDYTFDLDRSTDVDAGKLRRAKQLARENRKRRRTATLLQLSQEPELPATQPLPETGMFSSQPSGMSSPRKILFSDPIHAMSQPSIGPFGRRPNKKIKKRKGGF
ncbi:RNA polymerase I-specific transcription initiation factor RRN6-like protein [Xylaria flabelliformis]|nr:RNA polymerase I-specific transcription initiation factor RRN6-like protein [Xylaria flabelliformis]